MPVGNGVKLENVTATLVYTGQWKLVLEDRKTESEYQQPITNKRFAPAPKKIMSTDTNTDPCGLVQFAHKGAARNFTSVQNKCDYRIEVSDTKLAKLAKGTPTKEEEKVGTATVRFRALITSDHHDFQPSWWAGKLENVPITFMPPSS